MDTNDNSVKVKVTGKRVKLRCVKCSLSSYWYADLVGQVLEFYENDPSEEMSYSLAADIDQNRSTVGGADLGDWEIFTEKITRIIEGTLPADDLRRSFVDGAKWWEFHSTQGTMWASDRDLAEQEADRRYPDGKVPEGTVTAEQAVAMFPKLKG